MGALYWPRYKGKDMKKSKILVPILIIIGVILVDQLTKGMVLAKNLEYLAQMGAGTFSNVPLFAHMNDLIPNPMVPQSYFSSFGFSIMFTWNPGTSFSLFRALGTAAPIILIVLSAIIIGFLGYYLFKKTNSGMEKWGLALIVGGALGNLIDRLRFGAVVDFLDFHVKTWHWPAFNFADICICVGVGLYVLYWLFFNTNKKGK